MKKPRSLHAQILAGLGKTWMWWSPRLEVKKRCKVDGKTGWYRCEICKQEREKIEVDHIKPIVSVTDGFTNWDTYINARFVTADKLQGLCRECHKKKSQEENKERRKRKVLRGIVCQHDDSGWCIESCPRGKIYE